MMMKRRSIFSNAAYILKTLFQAEHHELLFQILEVLANSAVPLLAAIAPALAVSWLTMGLPMNSYALKVMIVFAGYALVGGIQGYLTNRNDLQYITCRFSAFIMPLTDVNLSIDLQVFESSAYKKEMEKAEEATGSNQQGLEGMMHLLTLMFTAVLQVLIFSVILGRLELWILLLLLGIAVAKYLSFTMVTHYKLKHKDEMATLEMTEMYLTRTISKPATGKDIRLYQLHDWLSGIYRRNNKRKLAITSQQNRYYLYYDTIGLILQAVQDLICYLYMLYRVVNGMDIASFILYLNVISSYATAFVSISDTWALMNDSSLMIDDFRNFMEKYQQPLATTDQQKHSVNAEGLDIVFDHVCFRYTGSMTDTIHDLSFHIAPGQRFALVGINGAGKSTIVKLLCGLYHPSSGRILIDGIDLEKYGPTQQRLQTAALFQDTKLLEATIAENISGLPQGQQDRKRINQVLDQVGLADKVTNLAHGMDTYVGRLVTEEGIQLSGGQTQSLLLARCLYQPHPLLILDEPTASLDPLAESQMYQRYQKYTSNCTSLFISHRLASTRFCDSIIFLQNGRIVQQGTHDELIKQQGPYAQMFEVQAQYYQKGAQNDDHKPVLAEE